MFNTSNLIWTWIGGSNSPNQIGVYGTLGQATIQGPPGARAQHCTLVDKNGAAWVIGGFFIPSGTNEQGREFFYLSYI